MLHTQDIQPLTDEELAQRARTSPDVYAHLISRYEDKLSRYIRRIALFSPEEVEDILQDAFIKTYEHLNDFDATLKFSSWIYRITHNEAISALRKRGTVIISQDETYDEIIENIASTTNHEHEVDSKIQSEQLRNAMGRLPEKYRDVLILKFLEEKSYEEISDILRVPIGTVGTLINRAKKQLAPLIQRHL